MNNISYISIYSSDSRKELELYERCCDIGKPLRYGKNLEILIPWCDWNNYMTTLFPRRDLEEFDSLELREYIWETDEKFRILPDHILRKFFEVQFNPYVRTKPLSYVGSLISRYITMDGVNRVIILRSFGKQEENGLLLDIDPFCIKDSLPLDELIKMYPEVDELVKRRFINSNPERFEYLNNVINKI